MTINGVPCRLVSEGPTALDEWVITDNTYCPACRGLIHVQGMRVFDLLEISPVYQPGSWWLYIKESKWICGHPDCMPVILLNPLAYEI